MITPGSQWRRWEPHIHAPGTLLNDQFGEDSWEEYLTNLETAIPKIEAIAVTDYYVTETYMEMLRYKKAGRLPDVQLIFPNVELRLDVRAKTGFVNVHLLVSPEDSDHIKQLHRLLTRLQFFAHNDRFNCTRDDLISLGKKADPSITGDHKALQHGATQFKVNFDKLREVLHESDWAKKNILVAVAGGSRDGTSGLRLAADTTMREEIEKFAHIIFSSSTAQREFWLGQKAVSSEELHIRYNGCKPCLHGSDSHDLARIGQTQNDRFSWIKGCLEFDALRQACINPEGRAFVGSETPQFATQSQIITSVSISNASWAKVSEIPLNAGLVAIIGARGSGKTALADIIAAGCDAITPTTWNSNENTNPSFLVRARPLIGDASVTLTWGGGTKSTKALDGRDANSHLSYPRARYLSQQFVEDLCSSSGISDGLIEEIDRVILEAHPIDEREGAINFTEFRENRTSRFKQARERETDAIFDLSERIASELEKESLVKALTNQVAQKKTLLQNYNNDLAKLVVKGSQEQVKRHTELSEVAQDLRKKIKVFANQRRTFIAMQDEVLSTRETQAPRLLRQAKERHINSGLNDEQWDEFLLIYKGNVDNSLDIYIAWAEKNIAELTGKQVQTDDLNTSFIPDGIDLKTLSLSIIVAEMERLEALFSADKKVQEQYAALNKRIEYENEVLKTLETKLQDAQGAAKRRKALQAERVNAYKRVFEAIVGEQNELAIIYAPLMTRLESSSGTLSKLRCTVRRIVDFQQWGAYAEENLLDRRKTGPFNGRGSLISLVEKELKTAWESGSPDEVQASMEGFISSYQKDLLKHAPYAPTEREEYRKWLKRFAQWLFETDHIEIRYEITFDDVDIRKLSPGTRGIVLLLLYLALDESDDRPLIIDQPEENLDPKSVFNELVPLFIDAKTRRQVIIVTHNANLVINTDADQIIIAEAGPHEIGGLPSITYSGGGLEKATIRKAVCDTLEGGEAAFRERARRLRVHLER